MSTITITTNVADVQAWLGRLNINLKKGAFDIVDALGTIAQSELAIHSPDGVRPKGLKESWIKQRRKKSGKVIVKQDSSENNEIAHANEFGVTEYLEWKPTPLLRQWMKIKLGKEVIPLRIGGPHTRLGKANKFLDASFHSTIKLVPMAANEAILKAIKNTR